MRSSPGPFVNGFVAATGAMAVRSALSTLCRTPFHNLWPTRFGRLLRISTWVHMLVG